MNIGPQLLVGIFTLSLAKSLVCTEDGATENKAKLYQCLNTCAMCVEHWEPGLYNGPRCAKQCIKHKGQRLVDPDCDKLKMFNYDPEVIKEHRRYLREQSEKNNQLD